MTAALMKTETKQLIDLMSDEQIALVFDYLKSFLQEHEQKEIELSKKMEAVDELYGLWAKHDNTISVDETVRTMRKGRTF